MVIPKLVQCTGTGTKTERDDVGKIRVTAAR